MGITGLGAAWLTNRALSRLEPVYGRWVMGDGGWARSPQPPTPNPHPHPTPLAAAGVCAALALLGLGAVWISARYVEHSVHARRAAARNDHMGHDCWGLSPRPRAERGEGLLF